MEETIISRERERVRESLGGGGSVRVSVRKREREKLVGEGTIIGCNVCQIGTFVSTTASRPART